ncbi:hypothetical protein T261_3724 [Streptomyces lydicus]|nr:hypothetical protein T261_3724 [Streptomyces lydicus]
MARGYHPERLPDLENVSHEALNAPGEFIGGRLKIRCQLS